MPYVRPGWNIIQSVYLRIGAIEFLRALDRREHPVRFFDAWWAFWVETYGPPIPENGDVVQNYPAFVAQYQMASFTLSLYLPVNRRFVHPRGSTAPSIGTLHVVATSLPTPLLVSTVSVTFTTA